MRRLSIIVALLLLLSTSAPVLACMTGTAMAPQQNACCRQMHGDCGEMARTGCCRTEVRTDEHPQLATRISTLSVHWAVVAWLVPTSVTVDTTPAFLLDPPAEHSPPGLLTAKITVLRI